MPRYTVLMNDGIGSSALGPDAPAPDNTVTSLKAARELFRRWLDDSGNDYTRADGYGQPSADVVRTENWDGISYGDITGGDGVCRFERTPRGGIVRENY